MAGEWIKVRTNLWNDPRVSKLCDLTEESKASIVGALYWLWSTADEHTEDGHMPGLSIKGIDRESGIKGFGAALVTIEWITDDPDGVTLTRFDEHNGNSAKQRAQTAKRVANHKGNAKVTPAALPEQQETVSTALPREDKNKRREEVKATPKVNTLCEADAPIVRRKTDRPDDAVRIFEHWQRVTGHDKSVLDAKRVNVIKARLKDGYTVGQLCQAIDGNKADPWHQGANDRQNIVDGLHYICRDGPTVEKFIAIAERGPTTGRTANAQQTIDNLQAYLDQNP